MRAHQTFFAAAALSTLVLGLAAPAAAQDASRLYPADRFQPALDAEGLAVVDTAGVPNNFAFDAALLAGFESRPLTIGTGDASQALIGNRLRADVVASVALLEWVQVGAQLPVVLLQGRDEGSAPDDGARALAVIGPGDVRFRAKLRVLSQRHGQPFDLALLPEVSIPTGQLPDYFGEPGFTLTPMVAASKSAGGLRLAANAGVRLRGPVAEAPIRASHELVLKGAVGWLFDVVPDRPTEVALAVQSAASIDEGLRTPAQTEAILEVQHRVFGPIDLVVGGGAGLIGGRGTPDFRLYAGLRGAFLRSEGPAR